MHLPKPFLLSPGSFWSYSEAPTIPESLPTLLCEGSFLCSQNTCSEMATAFLGKPCPALKGCRFGQVAVLGLAGTGSDTLPMEPELNSCPASPGGYPELFCGCPATCQACLCLVLLQSGLQPLSQYGALARCQSLRRELLCPFGMPTPPEWSQL